MFVLRSSRRGAELARHFPANDRNPGLWKKPGSPSKAAIKPQSRDQ
jgi:hypothetical protein